MKNYIKNLQSDIPSAIVVFLVAIPLCLGIAVASGVNEFSGLVAGVVGGVVVGFLSGSHLSVSGPAAGLTAIVVAAVTKLPAVEAFFLAVVLGGILQLLMGFFKMGVIGHYIPNSVIKGLLAAIGIILIIKQIPYLMGIESGEYPAMGELFTALAAQVTPLAMFIGLIGIAILIVYETKWVKSKKIFQVVNGPLVAVLVGVLIYSFAGSGGAMNPGHLINLPVTKSFEEFTGLFQHPDFSYLANGDVWVIAVTLALVASLETLLGIEAVDKIDPYKRVTPNNRELLAQGSGNIISGLLGGLPLTSVIVRSSANMNAGAKTKSSTIIHGLMILVCVAFFPAILNLIPKAALAAVLIFTGYKLAKVSLFKEYYRKGWDQFIPFVVTTGAIVITDLLMGVIIGIIVAVFYILRDNFRTSIFMVKDKDNYLLRLRKDVSFFSKPIIKKKFESIPENSNLLIDITRAEYIDRDIMETIEEFMQQAPNKKINVQLSGTVMNGNGSKGFVKINSLKPKRVYDDVAH